MQPILALAKSAAIAGALAATAVYPLGSWGQSSSATWPKQIRIVVPFEPGASNDIFARLVGQRLAARTGSVVVVENKPGASGSIGAEYVSRAAADGSTLLATSTPFSASAAAQPKLPYDPVKGFAPVAMLASGPQILAVSADSPYRKISELIEAARANKGKLNYASTGVGSSHHLNTARFNMMAGTEMTHVPFKGGGPAVTNLIAGHIQVMIFAFSTLMPHIKSGKVRALAVTSPSRSRFAPDLPAISETVPGFSNESWWGVFAPGATSPALVSRFNAEFRAIAAMPEMREVFEREGVNPGTMTAEQFAAFVHSDIDNWRAVARKLNIAVE